MINAEDDEFVPQRSRQALQEHASVGAQLTFETQPGRHVRARTSRDRAALLSRECMDGRQGWSTTIGKAICIAMRRAARLALPLPSARPHRRVYCST